VAKKKEREQISWAFTMIEAGVETDYMVWPFKIATEANVRTQLKRESKNKKQMIKVYRIFDDKEREEFFPTTPRSSKTT